MANKKKFNELGLSEETLQVIIKKGFEMPTPIQEQMIPALLTGNKDLVGQARTGTGKTAAFGLPIIEMIKTGARNPQALILTPTRELAVQVAEEIHSLKGKKKMAIIPIYGGQSIELQLRHLKKGVDIVVGTPGRVIDHLKRRTLKLHEIQFLVLDEADEMLNMGFLEDVKEIIEKTSDKKRTMLFSATMPPAILQVAKKYMKDYNFIKVTSGALTVEQTEQIYFEVSESDKFEALCRIIDMEEVFYGLIFCHTKVNVDKVASHLVERGYDADSLHGDMAQFQREKIMAKFKKRKITILVATDVAARGIDVLDLTHVINYALPYDPESYVHRIGRTGRAGKGGIAITFITPSEYRRLQFIKRTAKTDIKKAKLPNIKEIIAMKKKRVQTQLENIIHGEIHEEYTKMAHDLLKGNESHDIIAALLKHSFHEVLDEKRYAEIDDSVSVDRKGTTRLFVRKGREDGMTPKKLVMLIIDKCKIPGRKINDVQVLDRFSFVTLPFHEAETVLAYFNSEKKGSGPIIMKANKSRSGRRK